MEEKISQIESMFQRREEIVEEETKKIFSEVNNSVLGIDTFLSSADEIFSHGQIEWEDIQFLEDNGIIVFFGLLSFVPGSTIKVGEKMAMVTDENSNSFNRMIQISLPISLVASDSVEEVIEFLKKVSKSNSKIEKKETEAQSFNLDKLTEDQKKNLIVNIESMSKPN